MSELALHLIAKAEQEKAKVLDLGKCGLTELPEELFELEWLEELCVCNRYWDLEKGEWIESKNTGGENNLHSISPRINKLPGLQALYIGGDFTGTWEISDITSLKDLSQLTTLDLNDNNISHVPSWIVKRKFKIKNNNYGHTGCFTIRNNPLAHPPAEIVEQGHEAVVRFFEELEKGEDLLYEAKLLLVGEGGVGKTTFLRKLNNPDAAMPKQEERTRGIDIVQYTFKNEEDKTITLNIWDFGGQDIYHATHRFFLTHRSFYVLMTETRRQDDNFDYWIPNIQLFAGDSPILVVKNLMDGFQRQISIGRFLAKEKFHIADKVFDVDLRKNQGLDELKKALHFHIRRLPLIGQVIPESWTDIRKALEIRVKDQPYISFEGFMSVCHESNLTETDKIYDLGKYFHDLGIILWYHYIPVLKSKVILDPHWASDAVYLVIDDNGIKNQHGSFTKKDAARVWCDKKYCRMHDELLELMKAFRLCYKKKQKDEYIIPSLLLPDPPDRGVCWDESSGLRLYFTYEFMPKGIVNQLIAELCRYIPDDDCVWSRGVVLEDDQAKARVIEEWGLKQIRVNTRGKDARGFMRLIIEALEDIHGTYPGIEVAKQVPCQCNACTAKEKPQIFEYENLVRWMNEDKPSVYCNEGGEFFKIEEMLLNIGIHPSGLRKANGFAHAGAKGESREKPLKVFISYSKADIAFTNNLKKHLKPLEQAGDISTWYDRDMEPGDEWDNEVKRRLDKADIILFLVSPDFLSTDYIHDIEIPKALKRHESGDSRVVPIILRPCTWEGRFTLFSKLLALPDKDKTISDFGGQDAAWLKVVQGIRRVIDSLIHPRDGDW